MHGNIKDRLLIPSFLLLILLLVGCGSGDSSGDGPTPSENDDPPPSDDTNVNQGLTGYLYTAARISNTNTDKYPVIIDLATGRSHRILEPLTFDHKFTAPFPSSDGRTLVTSGSNSECGDTDFADYYDECVFIAKLGQSIEIIRPLDTTSLTRISPNGNLLAGAGQLINGNINTDALRLISLDGELIQTVGDFEIGSFTWLPDGRLMFVWDHTIYLTHSPYDLNATAVYTHDNGDEGAPAYLSPSHDGTRVAFMVSGTRQENFAHYSYIMVMNIDGSGLRQLTDSAPDDINPKHYYPVWSPDNQWIMVHEDLFQGTALYAVRSSATRVILEGDQYAQGDAIKIQHDMYDHLSITSTTSPGGNSAWLSVAPFLDTSARPSLNTSVTDNLPQQLIGEWQSPCNDQGTNSSKTTLQFNTDQCTELEQFFSDSNCSEVASETEKSTNCHLGETLITDSGLTATQLIVEDDSVLPGTNILYQDGDLLYLGQGSTLELEMPYTMLESDP